MRGHRRGTTLPELLIVMGIMGILLVLAEKVVVFGYEFYRITDESITLQKEGLLALTWLGQDAALSHHVSLVVEEDLPITTRGSATLREDNLLLPLPRQVDGTPIVNTKGALTWRSLAGYEIDTATHQLKRYLVDTADVPAPNPFLTGQPAPDDYLENIEFVTTMPTVPDLTTPAYATSLNARVVARSVVSMTCQKNVDTLDIQIVIELPGRVQGGNSLDNSLTLETTVYPKN